MILETLEEYNDLLSAVNKLKFEKISNKALKNKIEKLCEDLDMLAGKMSNDDNLTDDKVNMYTADMRSLIRSTLDSNQNLDDTLKEQLTNLFNKAATLNNYLIKELNKHQKAMSSAKYALDNWSDATKTLSPLEKIQLYQKHRANDTFLEQFRMTKQGNDARKIPLISAIILEATEKKSPKHDYDAMINIITTTRLVNFLIDELVKSPEIAMKLLQSKEFITHLTPFQIMDLYHTHRASNIFMNEFDKMPPERRIPLVSDIIKKAEEIRSKNTEEYKNLDRNVTGSRLQKYKELEENNQQSKNFKEKLPNKNQNKLEPENQDKVRNPSNQPRRF